MEAAVTYDIWDAEFPNFLRHHPTFGGVCSACGTESRVPGPGSKRRRHRERKDCPKRKNKTLKCNYVLCPDQSEHDTLACRELHCLCPTCGCRGHDAPRCDLLPAEDFQELYDTWRDQGLFTRAGRERPFEHSQWEFQGPTVSKEECFWRMGDSQGIWAPDMAGLDWSITEGRDQLIKDVRWA